MQEKLKELGLIRYPISNVGKRIRNHLWVHINYLDCISSSLSSHPVWSQLPTDARPAIARINLKNWNELTLIECDDFDSVQEPTVGRSFSLKSDQTLRVVEPPANNPLIYHHKWLFVRDDYAGFNVVTSKQRSLSWRAIAGQDRQLSSRIGRKDFWVTWLASAGLAP